MRVNGIEVNSIERAIGIFLVAILHFASFCLALFYFLFIITMRDSPHILYHRTLIYLNILTLEWATCRVGQTTQASPRSFTLSFILGKWSQLTLARSIARSVFFPPLTVIYSATDVRRCYWYIYLRGGFLCGSCKGGCS